jgi:hypothetical protein
MAAGVIAALVLDPEDQAAAELVKLKQGDQEQLVKETTELQTLGLVVVAQVAAVPEELEELEIVPEELEELA